jgi:hypothetical protein
MQQQLQSGGGGDGSGSVTAAGATSSNTSGSSNRRPPQHSAAASGSNRAGASQSRSSSGSSVVAAAAASSSSSSSVYNPLAYLDHISAPSTGKTSSKKRSLDSSTGGSNSSGAGGNSSSISMGVASLADGSGVGGAEYSGDAAFELEDGTGAGSKKRKKPRLSSLSSTAAQPLNTDASASTAAALALMPLLPVRDLLPWEIAADSVLKDLGKHAYVDPSKPLTTVANFYIPMDPLQLSQEYRQLVTKRPPMDLSTLGYVRYVLVLCVSVCVCVSV